ncbi:phosphatase 2C-like domain-containing protein [Hyaloraphidium curvatum]|nr:phosphatase 2C-like domain-containing protein [Hyaloraphidium curvatum]
MESDQTVDERPTLYLHCGAAQAQGSRGYQQDALSFVDNGLMAEGEAAAMAEPSPVAEKEGARRHAIIGVFDGHGSESYARHASENIHRHIVEDKAFTEGNFPLALANGFLAEDRELYQTVHVEEKRGGTTATVALIVDDMLFIANVGDSRAVLAERGEGTDFFAIRVSQDHKPSVPKEQVRLQNTEAIVSQGRVHTRTHSLNMTRALGDFAFKAPANEASAKSSPRGHA